MQKGYTFFIEGGDNVGKTTMIEYFKNNYIKNLSNFLKDSVTITRYPSNRMTDYLNNANKLLKDIDSNPEYILKESYKLYIHGDIMNKNLNDMNNSFSVYNNKSIEICDRGPLSTYLYQYREMNKQPLIESLELFINLFIYNKFIVGNINASDITIVILHNNNPNEKLISDKQESIEYKKDFDNNISLQYRIENDINSIVKEIKEGNTNINNHVNFKYINIYSDNGQRRKTPEELCIEFIDIMNSIINKEDIQMKLSETVELMNGEDFKDRFKAEYYQLKIRTEGLKAMLDKMENDTLPFTPKCSYNILYNQYLIMEQYKTTLEKRAKIEDIEL